MENTTPAASPLDIPVMPSVGYCPYCGSAAVKHVKGVPRCTDCLAVFFVNFSRYTRRSCRQPRCEKLREECEAPGDIRALKYRIHELEGEVIGYKRILDDQAKAVPVEIAHVMQQALDALCLPCARWNKQQTLIINAAITALRDALDARETK